MICKSCGNYIHDESEYCFHCGKPTKNNKAIKLAKIVIMLIVGFIVGTLVGKGIIYYNFNKKAATNIEKTVVSEPVKKSEQIKDTEVEKHESIINVIEPEDFSVAQKNFLNNMGKEYQEIAWRTENFVEENPEIIISTVPYNRNFDNKYDELIVGITNASAKTIEVMAKGEILNKDNETIGEISINSFAIGAGNTYIESGNLFADKAIPTGEICWHEFEVYESDQETGSGVIQYKTNSDDIKMLDKIELEFFNMNSEPEKLNKVGVLFLDENGNVVGICNTIYSETIDPGATANVEIRVYESDEKIDKARVLSVFVNPTIVSY